MGNMTFQRGSPDGRDIFESAMPGSTTSSSDKDVATYIDVKKTDVHPAGGITFDENRNIHGKEIREALVPLNISALLEGVIAASREELRPEERGNDAVVMHRQPSRRHLIDGQDAQSVYSHTCCVFIAK